MAPNCKIILLFGLAVTTALWLRYSHHILKEYKNTEPTIDPTNSIGRIGMIQRTEPLIPRSEYNITILDWSPAFFSRENGLPMNIKFGHCLITRDKSMLDDSDAIVIEVRNIPHLENMPQRRYLWQRWVYLNVEAPPNAILEYKGNYKMADFKGKLAFNWTMTYRTDADVPMLHGWKTKKTIEERQRNDNNSNNNNSNDYHFTMGRNKGVSAMISNCYIVQNHRMMYVRELQKHIHVDIYGDCGGKLKLYCDGHFKQACTKMQQYMFYLAFENSNCRDYITEKIWMNGYQQGAVPVVLGAYKEDYLKQAPPKSIIFVEDFKTPKDLADYLNFLMKNQSAYRKYHEWRETYNVDVDFRFMGNHTWTKLCNALTKRKSEKAKWYDVITNFESVEGNCFQNEWIRSKIKSRYIWLYRYLPVLVVLCIIILFSIFFYAFFRKGVGKIYWSIGRIGGGEGV